MSHKPTKAERLARVGTVMELLAAGGRRRDIVQYCADSFKVGERCADNYIRDAFELMAKQAEFRHDRELGRSLVRLNNIFVRCMADELYAVALNVEAKRIQLLGLAEPSTIRHLLQPEGDLSDDEMAGKSDGELRKLIDTPEDGTSPRLN